MNKLVQRYVTHDVMTDVGSMAHMVTNIPTHIETIVTYTQNILMHQHWSQCYGLELSAERTREPFIRRFEDKLKLLRDKGFAHVCEQHDNESKMIAICRDFSIVAAALCREAGIPARVRCGFATYFEQGQYIDHWVLEYWHAEQRKWIMVDAQLDALQQTILNVPFDPLDVSEDYFITAPRAWLMCREGRLNPELFGILQWWGYDYLRCNLILDVNACLGMAMQPWDMWAGYKSIPMGEWTEEDFNTMDELAIIALDVNHSLEQLCQFAESNGKIKVPQNLNHVYNRFELGS